MKAPDLETTVKLYHDVARANGSVMSITEILGLLPERASEAELARVIESSRLLKSKLEIKSGYVVDKAGEAELGTTLKENARSRMAASSNMRAAAVFFSLMHSNPFRMVSVSGSTSYNSASRSKDVDFFCVAPRDELWLSLTHGLIMARVFSLLHRDAPQICFSCVMDEAYARLLFRSPRGPLFARDALELKVFRGSELYESLLQQASWISVLYPARFPSLGDRDASLESARAGKSTLVRVLNGFLFLAVGGFIRVKSSLHNRRFVSLGQSENEFAVRSGKDHLIYESSRYQRLRQKYDEAFARGVHPQG